MSTRIDAGVSRLPCRWLRALLFLSILVVSVHAAQPELTSIDTLTGAGGSALGAEDTTFSIPWNTLFNATHATDSDGTIVGYRIISLTAGTLEKQNGGSGSWATMTINDQFGAGDSIRWTPAPNANGDINAFVVKVIDNDSNFSLDSAIVTIRVAAVNDDPTLTTVNPLTPSGAHLEDTAITILYNELKIAADESDIDGDTVNFVIAAAAAGLQYKQGSNAARAAIAGDVVTNADTLIWTPPTNANGTLDAFTITASDGNATSATPIQVQIVVTAVDDPPILTTVDPLTPSGDHLEDTAIAITYTDLQGAAQESDVDSTTINFVIAAAATGLQYKQGSSAARTAVAGDVVTSADTLIWTPPVNANGTLDAFSIKAKDATSTSATPVQVQVVVMAVDDPPVLTTINPLTPSGAHLEDTPITITYTDLQGAADESDIDSATINFVVATSAAGLQYKQGTSAARAAVAGDVVTSADTLIWTPPANANGTLDAFTIKAKDATSVSATPVQVHVVVTPVDDPPVLTSANPLTPSGANLEDTAITITCTDLQVAAQDSDVDSTTINFVIAAAATGLQYQQGLGTARAAVAGDIVTSDDVLIWTPPADANGTLNAFTIQASDGNSTSASPIQIQVVVAPVNDPPTMATVAPLTLAAAAEDTDIVITYANIQGVADEADIDNAAVGFKIAGSASGTLQYKHGGDAARAAAAGDIINAGDSLIWLPDPNADGTLPVCSLTATDGSLASAIPCTLNVIVTPVDDAPSFVSTTLDAVPHTLGGAPTRLAQGSADLVDPDSQAEFRDNYDGKALVAGLVAAADVATPTTDDVLAVLPVGSVTLVRIGTGAELRTTDASPRTIATCTATQTTGAGQIRLHLTAATTTDDLGSIVACIHYRNDLGRSADTALPRRASLFVDGANAGRSTTVDVLLSQSDPPEATVAMVYLAPLSSTTISTDNLSVRYTDLIRVTNAPLLGSLSRASTGAAIELGGTFTPTDIVNGEIRYKHTNPNAGFDQIGLRLERGALATTVFLTVNANQASQNYIITSDAPLMAKLGALAATNTFTLTASVPQGASTRCTYEIVDPNGPATISIDHANSKLMISPTAIGTLTFEIHYRAYSGDLSAPVLTGDILARQKVVIVIVPTDAPATAGGAG